MGFGARQQVAEVQRVEVLLLFYPEKTIFHKRKTFRRKGPHWGRSGGIFSGFFNNKCK